LVSVVPLTGIVKRSWIPLIVVVVLTVSGLVVSRFHRQFASQNLNANARAGIEKMFTYANHVGLYAEQISATGEQVGNFPQAFTHLALISAAINLDRALN
jgi:GH15 family glucan-1,4-alpha-glucosidase